MSRILIVDDSPSVLETVEEMLLGAGHRVRTCASGKQALQMVRREAFDLVLTDIFMPDADGLEVIRETRRIRPALPIVAMSGMTGELCMLPIAKCMGAVQILRKPFLIAPLLEAVASALAGGGRTTPPPGVGLPE